MKRHLASAFSLVEVTLALGIAAFCLIAVSGLLPVGIQTNRNATSQTRATNILTSVVGDLRAAPVPRPTPSPVPSRLYGITIPPTGTSSGVAQIRYFDSEGRCSCDSAGLQKVNPQTGNCSDSWTSPLQLRYLLSVTFPLPPTGFSYADLKVTWPAAAAPANASGSVEMFTAFDRN